MHAKLAQRPFATFRPEQVLLKTFLRCLKPTSCHRELTLPSFLLLQIYSVKPISQHCVPLLLNVFATPIHHQVLGDELDLIYLCTKT